MPHHGKQGVTRRLKALWTLPSPFPKQKVFEADTLAKSIFNPFYSASTIKIDGDPTPVPPTLPPIRPYRPPPAPVRRRQVAQGRSATEGCFPKPQWFWMAGLRSSEVRISTKNQLYSWSWVKIGCFWQFFFASIWQSFQFLNFVVSVKIRENDSQTHFWLRLFFLVGQVCHNLSNDPTENVFVIFRFLLLQQFNFQIRKSLTRLHHCHMSLFVMVPGLFCNWNGRFVVLRCFTSWALASKCRELGMQNIVKRQMRIFICTD